MRQARIRARAQAQAQVQLPQNWQPLLWSIGVILSATALYLASIG